MNILYHGFQPQRPLHMEECFNREVSDRVCATLTTEPLAVNRDGQRLVCVLAEVRADWKFLKDMGSIPSKLIVINDPWPPSDHKRCKSFSGLACYKFPVAPSYISI